MKLDPESRKEKSIFITAFIVIQAIIIIIAISVVSLSVHDEKVSNIDYGRQSKIEIEDIDSALPGVTQDYLDILGQKIAKTIELNSQSYDTSKSKAVIREGTFKMTNLKRDNTSFYSMIIDIPNLGQSYQIYDHYSGDEEPANRMYVLCLDDKREIVYPDFQCKDDYPANIRDAIVAGYLKYFNFDYFSASLDVNNPSAIIINPSVTYDNDNATKSRYIEEVKSAIESLGVSPDRYKYYVRTAADVNYDNQD